MDIRKDDGIVYSAKKYRETDGIKVNRSHSVAYAKISLMTAYLKCYYPVEFMAALLTMSEGKKDRNGVARNVHYMKDAESMNIQILPPDVNKSLSGWTPLTYETPITDDDGKDIIGEIRYGLSSIAKVSGESVNEIIDNRPYESVEDLVAKTSGRKVNKTKVEALIKSGAFDQMTPNRNLLLRDYYMSRREPYDHIPETTNRAMIIGHEVETLGVSVSIKSRWEKVEDGANTQVTGTILVVNSWVAKSSGKTHYTLTVETNEDPVSVTVWGYLLEQNSDTYRIGNKVTIRGEKSRDKLTAKSVTLLINMYE